MKTALLGLLVTSIISTTAAAEQIPLTPDHFDTSNARAVSFKSIKGRQAVCFNGGAILAKGVGLENGTVQVDIENKHHRHFANIVFRARDTHHHEAAYLRMHKSRQLDAVQYTPHLNAETNWQLFGDAQMIADFGTSDWVTLRVSYRDSKALISVLTDNGEYEMPISELALGTDGNKVGLRSLFPACFSNLTIDTQTPDLSSVTDDKSLTSAGLISTWRLSPSSAYSTFDNNISYSSEWESVETERNGTVLISRFRQKQSGGDFEQNGVDVVYVGTKIKSDEPRTVSLNFDASDIGRVYLNGKPLAEINNSFRAKGSPLFRGDFDIKTQSVMLDLKQGENDLVIGVADRANGWGVAAQLADMTGLTLTTD